MRVLHLSTTDTHGGAAKVAYRLHTLMGQSGHDSRLIVRHKYSSDPSVAQAPQAYWQTQWQRLRRHLPLFGMPRTSFTFNHDRSVGIDLRRLGDEQAQRFDLVCLHWIARFLSAWEIRELYKRWQVPFLWQLLDQEPVTGGCHYSFGCEGYRGACGNCPLLERPAADDASHQVWLRKQRYLSDLPIVFIAPTAWCADRIRKSSLFGQHRVEQIPLPLDCQVFAPAERSVVRTALGLPLHKRLILFGASFLNEPRKGGRELLAALERLKALLADSPEISQSVELVMIGERGAELAHQSPFPVHQLGPRSDGPDLAAAYQAADLSVCPSLEDAGPMMVSEALLRGTPVVAFGTGIALELLASGECGNLARMGDSGDLARGMLAVMRHPVPQQLAAAARQAAIERHEPLQIMRRYEELHAELCPAVLPHAASERSRVVA